MIFKKGNIYTLALGDLSFSVSAATGGRIVSFQRGGEEILSSAGIHPVYYGGTFWISPQSNYWPQYPSIDILPYKAEILKNRLRLTSVSDTVNGIRIIKEFSISVKDTAVLINYTIENISGKAKRLAPWDVTRVPGGLSFFPLGEASAGNTSDVKNTIEKDGILWFTFTPDTLAEKQKLYSTNRGGWFGHCYRNLLFLKCFPDILPTDAPDHQGEIELFVAPHGRYIELENHGKYTTLLPGKALAYNQKWFLLYSTRFQDMSKSVLLNQVEKLNRKLNN